MSTLDSKELQKIEVTSKIIKDYIQALLDYGLEHRMKFMTMDDILGVHKIKFDFDLTDECMLKDEELNEIMQDTIRGSMKCIKMAMDECGVNKIPIEFFESCHKDYNWKTFFNAFMK